MYAMPKKIAVIGAFDTKGEDYSFVKSEIEKRGHSALMIDISVMDKPGFQPDVSANLVAEAAGTTLKELRSKEDRGHAMEMIAKGIVPVVKELYDTGIIGAVFSMGGSGGTGAGTAAMRALPLGVPKVMVSTVASGDTKAYVGTRDVIMFPSIVDVSGVNSFSARIYANAVGAIIGMLETRAPEIEAKPLLAASMFGNTTPIVTHCREIMEDNGYEVLVFHAVGTGGMTLESLIEEGHIDGVLDISPTELADELAGGELSAGPARLEAASNRGIPQVIVPGCVDMVNFWARETVPEKYNDRRFYQWAPGVTLMRTDPMENAELGRQLSEKTNKSTGPVAIFLPLKGVSMLDAPGKEFWWPEANEALYKAIKSNARAETEIIGMDNNVNDQDFSDAVADKMLEFLGKK